MTRQDELQFLRYLNWILFIPTVIYSAATGSLFGWIMAVILGCFILENRSNKK